MIVSKAMEPQMSVGTGLNLLRVDQLKDLVRNTVFKRLQKQSCGTLHRALAAFVHTAAYTIKI